MFTRTAHASIAIKGKAVSRSTEYRHWEDHNTLLAEKCHDDVQNSEAADLEPWGFDATEESAEDDVKVEESEDDVEFEDDVEVEESEDGVEFEDERIRGCYQNAAISPQVSDSLEECDENDDISSMPSSQPDSVDAHLCCTSSNDDGGATAMSNSTSNPLGPSSHEDIITKAVIEAMMIQGIFTKKFYECLELWKKVVSIV